MSPAQIARVRRYRSATQSKRVGSLGVSVLMHCAILFAILFVPQGKPVKIDLDSPIITLTQVTIGASGPKPTAPPPVENPAPVPPQPAAEPEAVPVPKIEEVAQQAEPPTPVPAEPEPEPEVKGPTDEELLAAALAGATSDAKPAPKVSGGESLLADALRTAGSDAQAERVVTGEGGDGIGFHGIYEDSIISRVRPHFTIRPHTDGRVYVVVVLLEIAQDGTLTGVSVKTPSGDPLLDANVVRAVREAGKFEPPPKPQYRRMEIPFTSDIYAGQ